jgi:hypothetical protein
MGCREAVAVAEAECIVGASLAISSCMMEAVALVVVVAVAVATWGEDEEDVIKASSSAAACVLVFMAAVGGVASSGTFVPMPVSLVVVEVLADSFGSGLGTDSLVMEKGAAVPPSVTCTSGTTHAHDPKASVVVSLGQGSQIKEPSLGAKVLSGQSKQFPIAV